MKLFTVALILCLQADSLLGVAVPEFHNFFVKNQNIANYFYGNHQHAECKVEDGVIYLPNHSSNEAEKIIGEILQETLKPYDSRFSQGVSAYWTLHIKVARRNRASPLHSYAKSLPTGIQTIKRRLPAVWMGLTVMDWSDVAEKKVIVY